MTRKISVGGVDIGGDAPVTVQSMCNTRTEDVTSTVAQIKRLEEAGCDIVRVAVPTTEAAKALKEIKQQIKIPLVADIHFDYKLALESVNSGADKIRINPGNIGSKDRVKAVVDACRGHGIPIRIGVNSGSVAKEQLEKYGGATPKALVESALMHIKILEDLDFYDTVVAIKASSVPVMIDSYRLFSEVRIWEGFPYTPHYDYPLHLGVTEAGTSYMGIVKSAVGIGSLLSDGIGDTIRVSLTADPVDEVPAGIAILKALELRKSGVSIVSCPSCGRCGIDQISLAKEVENRTRHLELDIKIAVMGCVVNGPGEARDADFGITGGEGVGLIFKKGEVVKKVPYDALVDELMALIFEQGK